MVRDRKAFLLHSQFVDTSIFKAVAAIQHVLDSRPNMKDEMNSSPGSILHEDHVGDLLVLVKRDIRGGTKKFESSQKESSTHKENAKKNLIKGLTADESVVVNVCHNSFMQGYRCICICRARYSLHLLLAH